MGFYELVNTVACAFVGTCAVWTCDYIGMKVCQALGAVDKVGSLYFQTMPPIIYVDAFSVRYNTINDKKGDE